MRIRVRQNAPADFQFGPQAFDLSVGKNVPAEIDGSVVFGKLVEAEVAEDGRSVALTMDVSEEVWRDLEELGVEVSLSPTTI